MIRRLLPCLALVPLAGLLAPPALSGAGVDYAQCTYSEETAVLHVRVKDEEGVVRRRGDRIIVREPTGRARPRYETVTCDGGQATVHNTDLIDFEVGSIGATDGRISLAGGPLTPGATPEADGSPEIEIVASVKEEGGELRIEGTGDADRIRGGRTAEGNAINLNPEAEGETPDADLRLARPGREPVGFRTGRGRDVVTMNGGPEFSGSLRTSVFAGLGLGPDRYLADSSASIVRAGQGADRVTTGERRDVVFDGKGNDRVKTRGADDAIAGGPGFDRFWTGSGKDLIFALDGRRDRIDCGSGIDEVFADRKDVTSSCERIKYR